jgi:hypothetical protein
MLNSPRSFEDEGVACTPSTTLCRSPQTCDSRFTQPVFTPLEITRDSSNDASTSRRRDSSDSEEDHKRVRLTLGSSSPDPTPNPDDPQSTSAPINSPVRALGWRDQDIPTESVLKLQTPTKVQATPTNPSIAQPDSDIAPSMSNVAVDAEQNGESGQGLGTTASLIQEVGRMSPFSAYPQSHMRCADVLDKSLDGPGMTNLINMSIFGRLRDLVNLRLDQETAIRMKDEEIGTLRANEERLNEQITRLDLELKNASLDFHPQRKPSSELAILRRLNEELKQRIDIQAGHIARLTEERDTLKADSGNLLRRWRKMKEEEIEVQSPTPPPARPSLSQSSPVIVKLGGPSVASRSTKSPSSSRITKKSYASRMTPDGNWEGDVLAVRISGRILEATAADLELQEGSGDDLPQSSSVWKQTGDATRHRDTPTRPRNKASSSTHPTVRPILRSRYEAPYDADHENGNNIATHVGVPASGTSRRIANELRSPLDWKPDDVESGTYGGIHDRGQGQGLVADDLDAPSRWRMYLWNAPFAAKKTGGKVIEEPGTRQGV